MPDREDEDGDKAIRDYMNIGSSFTVIGQLNFLDNLPVPEFRYQGLPTRTLLQAFTDDFNITVAAIRARYIPFYTWEEHDLYWEAVDWKKANPEAYEKFAEDRKDIGGVPIALLANCETLAFLDGFLPKMQTENPSPVVAYAPGVDHKTDVWALTWDDYVKTRKIGLEYGKKVDMNVVSTSRAIKIMTLFYWSGGEDYRYEAIDIITYNLLIRYLLGLRRRS